MLVDCSIQVDVLFQKLTVHRTHQSVTEQGELGARRKTQPAGGSNLTDDLGESDLDRDALKLEVDGAGQGRLAAVDSVETPLVLAGGANVVGDRLDQGRGKKTESGTSVQENGDVGASENLALARDGLHVDPIAGDAVRARGDDGQLDEVTRVLGSVDTTESNDTGTVDLGAQSDTEGVGLGEALLVKLIEEGVVLGEYFLALAETQDTGGLLLGGASNTELEVLDLDRVADGNIVGVVGDGSAALAVLDVALVLEGLGGLGLADLVLADGLAELLVASYGKRGAVRVDPELVGTGIDLGVDLLGRVANLDYSIVSWSSWLRKRYVNLRGA
jgi:hypothetical protein